MNEYNGNYDARDDFDGLGLSDQSMMFELIASGDFKEFCDLLNSDSSIKNKESPETNVTPLMYAILKYDDPDENKVKDDKFVMKLLEVGANVGAKDLNDNTALHYAAKHGSEEMITSLFEKSVNLRAKNVKDQIPIHVALLENRFDIVTTFLKKDLSLMSDRIKVKGKGKEKECSIGDYVKVKLMAARKARNSKSYTPAEKTLGRMVMGSQTSKENQGIEAGPVPMRPPGK